MDAPSIIKRARARVGITQSELADRAGTSQSAVAAYESGAKSPSVRTLDRIVRATGATLDVTVREAPVARGALLTALRQDAIRIQAAAHRRHIRNIRIFGSAARGEETPQSDIDLLVEFDAIRYGLLPLAGFAQEVSALVGRPVDATTITLLSDAVREQALIEAVPL
jgi:uncharacterized protein